MTKIQTIQKQSARLTAPLRRLLPVVIACCLCVGGVAYAVNALAVSSPANVVIQACEGNATGLLRIVSNNQTQCLKRLETPISWNQSGGPPGPSGAHGPAGPLGPPGTAGNNGQPGNSNISGVQQLAVGNLTCLNGGWLFLTTLGSYSVCNGADGQNASDGGGNGGPPTSCLIINEVMLDGDGEAAPRDDQFVELYNGCSSMVDASGDTLVSHDSTASPVSENLIYTFPAATTSQIAAGGYYLLKSQHYDLGDNGEFAADPALDATAGALGLRAGDGTLLDSVAYGSQASPSSSLGEGSPAPLPAPAQSLARLPNGTDTGSNSSDFAATANITPGAANKN